MLEDPAVLCGTTLTSTTTSTAISSPVRMNPWVIWLMIQHFGRNLLELSLTQPWGWDGDFLLVQMLILESLSVLTVAIVDLSFET